MGVYPSLQVHVYEPMSLAQVEEVTSHSLSSAASHALISGSNQHQNHVTTNNIFCQVFDLNFIMLNFPWFLQPRLGVAEDSRTTDFQQVLLVLLLINQGCKL